MTWNERAVSPVVAVALLIGITVLLATTVALAMYSTDLGEAEQPEVTLSFEVDDSNNIVVRHEGGDPLDPDDIVVRNKSGVEFQLVNVEGEELAAGGTAVVGDDNGNPITATRGDEVMVIWQNPRTGNDAETILGTFRV